LARCSISSLSDPTTPAEAPRAAGSRIWQSALGLGLSLVFLYLAVHDVRLADIGREIAHAHPAWFVASILLATLTFPIRAVRLRLMLAAGGGPTPLWPVWQATAIGFMANNILPARGGELARAYAASRLVPCRFTAALGAIAVERVFDGLVLVLLLAAAIAAPGFPATASVGGHSVAALATWSGAVFVVLLAFLFVLVHAPAPVLRLGGAAVRRLLPLRAAEFALGVTRHFIAGLSILRAPQDFALVVVWSFVLWLVNAGAFYTGFLAFHLDALPLASALFLQGIVAIGVAIPQAPGFFGLFEATSRVGLGLYGVAATGAASFAIGIHLGWFIPITVIGLWTLARANLSLGELRGRQAAA
jgi:uncharacterized protein (TIRG00374 family)